MDLMEKYMTDIVEELEGMASVDPMVRLARDEIIRLRAQVEQLERHKESTMALLDKTLNVWSEQNDKMEKVLHD